MIIACSLIPAYSALCSLPPEAHDQCMTAGIPLLPGVDDIADPVVPGAPTNAPLILDMNNIPNPDDVGAGDVW